MGSDVVSRGVATFDALNANSGPYDSMTLSALVYADSLTSQFIDISTFAPADSLYFSFFFQPQGLGFMPEQQDSLMLFFKKIDESWSKVWSIEGTALAPFKQVMIPLTGTDFFGSQFQFRFINKASINLNDDVWNVDYIRFGAGRNLFDTAINDVATTKEPSFLLNDYTSMTYGQFLVNPAAELAMQHSFSARNNTPSAVPLSYRYITRELFTNTPLFTSASFNATLNPYEEQVFSFPQFMPSFPNPGNDARVIFESQYFIKPVTPTNVPANDTITKQQVFDNYLAYDDGTAEKSYFLNLFPTLPGRTAIEYHLNKPDSIHGIAIYFGRQVPLAFNKFFSVQVYQDIAVNGGTDQMIYQQDLLFPGYADTVNKFWYYRFDSPVPMPAGAFFIGTQQPASSGSDSLYFGLDVNRVGGNHLYYNVLNFWESSLVSGALMMRPLLSGDFTPSYVTDQEVIQANVSLYPNPAKDFISFKGLPEAAHYFFEVMDLQGRKLLNGSLKNNYSVDVQTLQAGVYFVRLFMPGKPAFTQKFIKL